MKISKRIVIVSAVVIVALLICSGATGFYIGYSKFSSESDARYEQGYKECNSYAQEKHMKAWNETRKIYGLEECTKFDILVDWSCPIPETFQDLYREGFRTEEKRCEALFGSE